MTYKLGAILVIALFYGIFFLKALFQKRKGIQTRQIGKRKERDAYLVEMLMSIAVVCVVPVEVVSILCERSVLPPVVRVLGFAIGIGGDVIFLIAVLTMKDSWRAGIPENEKTELITNGIYRYSRNPAFVGFDCMYLSVCLMFCNVCTVVFSLFPMVMLHLQILQEEKYLIATFAEAYLSYRNTTRRYWGTRTKAEK